MCYNYYKQFNHLTLCHDFSLRTENYMFHALINIMELRIEAEILNGSKTELEL